MPEPLTVDQANAIYDALVANADASGYGREGFVYLQTHGHLPEYRFIGSLGYGGKFRRTGRDDHWLVDCYQEDLTTVRRSAVETTNVALAALKQEATA